MHDFRCTNSVDMFYPVLAQQVKYFKETDGGRKIVCKAFEDLAEKRANEKVLEDRLITARMLLEKGSMSIEEIAAILRLSIEEVKKVAASKE